MTNGVAGHRLLNRSSGFWLPGGRGNGVKTSGKWHFYARLALLAAFVTALAWAIASLDWRAVLGQLKRADLSLELAMAGAWLAALCIRPARMLILVRTMAPRLRCPYSAVWSADVMAMAINSIFPMRAGDMMIALFLKQSVGLRVTRATSVVLVDRFFDFATVMVLFVGMLLAAPVVIPWAHNAALSLVVCLILLAGGLWTTIHLRRLWLAVAERLLGRIFPGVAQKWLRHAHDLFEGMAQIDRLGLVGGLAAVSLVQWLVISASYWLGIAAFYPGVPFAGAVFAACVVALSFVVPVAPGGFGVFHGAVVLALSVYGVPAEPALAFALIAHALQMGSVLVLGGLRLMAQGWSLRSLVNMRNSHT
jgi:uncharacterized protein (TIRG00374 family)